MEYPYSDEYMEFDERTGRYVLTEKYVFEKMGIDMRSSINERNGINPQILVQRFLTEVSDDVYEFVHSYNPANSARQDWLIAHCPSIRPIIQRAMDKQLMYSRLNGLIGYSAEKSVQEQRICPQTVAELSQIVPEIGRSILYTGVY